VFYFFQGFYCGTEAEFDDLSLTIRKFITCESRTPMFELYEFRPPHWPPYEPYSGQFASSSGISLLYVILRAILLLLLYKHGKI
jgi:hypothetical protein